MQVSNMQVMQPYLNVKRMQPDAQLSMKIGVSSEQSYTKEDAVKYRYNRQFDLYLPNIVTGEQASISCSNVASLGTLEEFQKKLETEGLGEDINWSGVSFDFSTVSVDMDVADRVSDKVNYIASRYAVLKDRVDTNYSGDRHSQEMEKLDSLFSEAKKLLADSYANVVGGFLEENGVSGETEKLRKSVLQEIDSQVDKYSQYIQNNEDYVKIDSQQDKWLLQDDAFMAARLRDNMDNTDNIQISGTEEKQSSLYSLYDMDMAGMYAKQTSEQYDSLDYTGFICNEESIGLDLAVQDIKTQYITKKTKMSSNMASVINSAFQGYMKNYVNKLNEQMKKSAEQTNISGSRQLYGPLDTSAIYNVYQYTMEQYRSNGDMQQALQSGSEFGKEQYEKKVDSADYGTMARYQSNIYSGYTWSNFFESTKTSPYDLPMSNIEKYAITFSYFVDSVNNQDPKGINMMFGFGGNSSADRITYFNLGDYTQNILKNIRA